MSKKLLLLLLALALSAFFVSCGDDDDDVTGPPAGQTQFEVVQAAVDAYTGDTDQDPTITAEQLFTRLTNSDDSDDPVVLSVRSEAHYALGHIEGAINIPWRDIAKTESLDQLPADQQIVVYCYTGHTGGVATTALNAMGYDAVNLKFGMMGWSSDPNVVVAAPFTQAAGYPTVTEETAAGEYALTDPDYTSSEDPDEIVRAAADAYTGDTDRDPTITAEQLFTRLTNSDDSDDPVVLSVRSEAHYALGHIEGAINIPWRDIAKTESLQKLPTDQQIVVYCYTGHTGAVATTALNMLGYDAVNLKFGMMGWSDDPNVVVAAPFTQAEGFPTEP